MRLQSFRHGFPVCLHRLVIVVVAAVVVRSLEAVPSSMRRYPVGDASHGASVPSMPECGAGRRAIGPVMRDEVAECSALPGLGALSLRSDDLLPVAA